MAASMVRGRARVCLHARLLKPSIRHASGPYYVLLPEVPPDTPETNPILRVTETPKFSAISPDQCVTGCARLALNYETRLGNHIESLQDPTIERTFERVFNPIEEVTVPLNYAWRTAKNLNYVLGNKGYREAFSRIHPQIERAKNERWTSEILFYAAKEVGQDSGNLTEAQRRLVDLYLLEGRLNGIELHGTDKKRFVDTLKVLALEKVNFRNRVMICQSMFSHRTDNFNIISDMPRRLVTTMAEDKTQPSRGPWNVTLQHYVYHGVLEHCNDRTLRWNVWQAFNGRGSVYFNSQNLGNHKLIEEIRTYRRDLAQLLGFENFAEMSMETKMAGTVENVLNMIETFKGSFKSVAMDEIKELQEFASAEGLADTLRMWDIAYWRKKQRDHIFKLDDSDIAQYFTLDKVLTQLFNLCTQLFGISFKEATDEVETWRDDVRYFKVYDHSGENISAFFLDPFSRPAEKLGGAWMEMGRERSDLAGTTPFSYLIMNLAPPLLKDGPVLMTFAEVSTLFHEFGHGLQQMLTKAPYSELAGQRNVEWDAVQVCAKFMQRWLTLPNIVQNISGHHQTGDPLPSDVVDRLLQSQKHMCGYEMMRQLYLSAFDMEMYISKTHWHESMTRTWEEYMPLPLDKDDHHPCSFTHIFSDQYPAAYYSYKWAEMIAADLFAAFEEAGIDKTDKLSAAGSRFRDTFLAYGGGVPSSEVFRRFRGRDPSLDALQIYYGVK